MIGMSTILSIRQRLDAGDSVAQVARDEGVSEPTVRNTATWTISPPL